MKRLLFLPVLLLSLLVGNPASSADFQKGKEAYKNKDYATALREWEPLAQQGNPNAQNGLGVLYSSGRGVPQNVKTAVKWFTLAAEQGYAKSQNNLGQMYDTGEGVPQNFKTAVKWYTLAAKQGIASAQYNLGAMYANGQGVPKNDKTAVKWFTLAAEQGTARAQYNLGLMYANGQGVPQNDKTAVKWYTLAAEQGLAVAQGNLGAMYANGTGVIQDNVYAHMWSNIAASQGNEGGKNNRDIIAKKMTPAEISKAKDLAQKKLEELQKKIVQLEKDKKPKPAKQVAKKSSNPSSADYQKGFDAANKGDYATALKEWKPLAEQGDALAQNGLGAMYARGQGVPQNYKTAVKWYTLAAKQGIASAEYALGLMYHQGQGVPQNYKTAVKWYRLAAEHGHVYAQSRVDDIKGMVETKKREKAERIARKKQRIATEKQRSAREKQSASNPGFRDLKPGLHFSTIEKKKVCKGSLNNRSGITCYGLDNMNFLGTFDKSSFLEKLTVDLGPIVGSVGFINELSTYLQKGETNIYLKMRNSLGEKYKIDFEFSERDRQLFNEKVKDKLYTVYNGGQVALLIKRKKRGYSRDLWLYVEYRGVKPAQRFHKSTKPKRAKASDF